MTLFHTQIALGNRELADAIAFGQFPEVIAQPHRDDKHEVFVNYRNTYFTPRDFRNLRRFEDKRGRPVKRFLFYTGDEYRAVDDIELIPVAALYRGC